MTNVIFFVPKVHCDGKTTLICSSKVMDSPFTNKNPHIFKLQNKSTTAELVGPKRYCCQNGCLETTWRSFHERAIKASFLDLFSHHFSVVHVHVMKCRGLEANSKLGRQHTNAPLADAISPFMSSL